MICGVVQGSFPRCSVKPVLHSALSLSFLFVMTAAPSNGPVVLDEVSYPIVWPGDWEPHDVVWLSWSPIDYYARTQPFRTPFFAIIRALHTRVKLRCLVDGPVEEANLYAQAQLAGVPSERIDVLHVGRTGPWMRDFGPLFVRCSGGAGLAVVDFDFNSWGYAEWNDDWARLDELVHKTVAARGHFPLVPVVKGPTGVRVAHEGGGVVFNGRGTMISVESVAMQRNLGPKRFYPTAHNPVTDWSSPTTYQPSADWDACKRQMEEVYGRSLGVSKTIWVPTGVIEDDAPFRGPVARHLHIGQWESRSVRHAGVWPSTTTNGHADEFVRFIAEDTVLLAQSHVEPLSAHPTAVEQVLHYIEQQNHDRMERAYAAIVGQTTADGRPLTIVRMPTPCVMLQLMEAGDVTFDRLAALHPTGSEYAIDECAVVVLPTSYCNYFVSNGTVLVGRYWKEGRPDEMRRRDEHAVRILQTAFPDREVVPIDVEAINVGGGGIHCITQQQPSLSERTDKL